MGYGLRLLWEPRVQELHRICGRPAALVCEGRKEAEEEELLAAEVLYGLWVVDAATTQIIPSNALAAQTVGRSCYQGP